MLFAQTWPNFIDFEKLITKLTQNRSKTWAIPMLFAPKCPKLTVFESFVNCSYFSKRCENDPKSIKTMGYSPCFMLRNGQISSILKG